MTDFLTVADADELKPGQRMVVQIGRTWVAVFNVDGALYAIQDVCTHDDGPLAEGALIGCEIECPRHGARFCLRTGAALSPPAYEPLRIFEAREVDGRVEVRV
jgi:3-phenylpropionate/trans-cinnamate dioxygenase ferredoxin subunit